MLGKASEINVCEVDLGRLNKWLHENSACSILDIKYAFHPDGTAYALIIYKEA